MHYFITGHTGFKGSWLIILLRELGHEVSGFSLPPVEGGLFERAGLEALLKHHYIGDIRDESLLKSAIHAARPDYVIHLAAQPLVLRSYEDPIETFTTNVEGTRNLLVAISSMEPAPATLVITTDKVYRDEGKPSYSENSPLGGHDSYSASKAMADILTQSWAAINPHLTLHVARAGNVIGAFDVSENRIVPDAVRALRRGEVLRVRNPEAIRPWQHVLDCLAGYLQFLTLSAERAALPVSLNFGPDPGSVRTVHDLLLTAKHAAPDLEFVEVASAHAKKETKTLALDSSMALEILNWRNVIGFEEAVAWSFAELNERNALETSKDQVRSFLERSRNS